MLTEPELLDLMSELKADNSERTASKNDRDKFGQAI